VKSIRLVLLVLGVVAAWLAVAPSAGASGGQAPTTPTTPTTLPGATAIGDNYAFTGASISSPADPTPRTFNGYQAAVFVQSWLPTAFYGKPALRDPPANVPVYRVDVMGTWGGTPPVAGTQSIYYASDGTKAFISYPQQQDPSTTPDPPPGSIWFVAPPRTIDAFNGTAKLLETAGVQEANTPRTAQTPNDSSSSSSSTPWVLYGVLVAAAIAIVIGVVLFFRRDSGPVAAAD
jgi:hypothetical protein